MTMNKSFAGFCGELVEVAKAAAGDKKIGIVTILETESKEVSDWMQTRMNPFFMPYLVNGYDQDIDMDDAYEARDKAIARHDEDLRLVHQGVFEHTDVGYSAICADKQLTAVYYDICERGDTVMLATTLLGKKLARLTIVMQADDGKDTYEPQRRVGDFIRGFLSKNNLGTMTSGAEFPAIA